MSEGAPLIRRGGARDLDDIAAIQSRCPEASQWNPADYLHHDLFVAVVESRIAGFLVMRNVGGGEGEILNLAVSPERRRRAIARALLWSGISSYKGTIFLEVRASNAGARKFYKCFGFQEVGARPGYYENPPEPAIVMKFHSC